MAILTRQVKEQNARRRLSACGFGIALVLVTQPLTASPLHFDYFLSGLPRGSVVFSDAMPGTVVDLDIQLGPFSFDEAHVDPTASTWIIESRDSFSYDISLTNPQIGTGAYRLSGAFPTDI